MIVETKLRYIKPRMNYKGRWTFFRTKVGIEKIIYLNQLFGIDTIYTTVLIKYNLVPVYLVVTSEIFDRSQFIPHIKKHHQWKSDIINLTIQLFIVWYSGFKVSDDLIGYYRNKPTILLHKIKPDFMGSRTFKGLIGRDCKDDYHDDFKLFKVIINKVELNLAKSLKITYVELFTTMAYNISVHRSLESWYKIMVRMVEMLK